MGLIDSIIEAVPTDELFAWGSARIHSLGEIQRHFQLLIRLGELHRSEFEARQPDSVLIFWADRWTEYVPRASCWNTFCRKVDLAFNSVAGNM